MFLQYIASITFIRSLMKLFNTIADYLKLPNPYLTLPESPAIATKGYQSMAGKLPMATYRGTRLRSYPDY